MSGSASPHEPSPEQARPAGPGPSKAHPTAPAPEGARRPGLRALLGYFLGLGTWGFGGPIATVGYMQRDPVERRGWLDRTDFLNGVAPGWPDPGWLIQVE